MSNSKTLNHHIGEPWTQDTRTAAELRQANSELMHANERLCNTADGLRRSLCEANERAANYQIELAKLQQRLSEEQDHIRQLREIYE